LRIAIFGGAFDPVHNAHLAVAREAARQFALDKVLLVPAANPPHKLLRAPYEDRYNMVALAVQGDPVLEASRLEAGTVKSFSIETIERLQAQLDPADELYFLIGADAFAEIRTWRRWRDVLRAVTFVVVSRPGHVYEAPPGARVRRLDSLSLGVSSSRIREALASGRDTSEVPAEVLNYIRHKGLYRE
jgi:nicotinate-nucleotide adenylyltransferase